MIVLKFGGTSVADPANIRKVIEIIAEARRERGAVAVVCSAFSGATDTLIRLCNLAEVRDETWRDVLTELGERHHAAVTELIGNKSERAETTAKVAAMLSDLGDTLQGIHLVREVSGRSRDFVMSFGERLSCTIISSAMQGHIDDVAYLDARQIIRTDDAYGMAQIDWEQTEHLIRTHFENTDALQVCTGFIASSPLGRTTTLGRGGSDYTVSILGAALRCEEIQIWTDVSGVLTADPRRVKTAFPVDAVSYEEAMELSHFGAKVIYSPTMAPAMKAGVPIRIKNTFEPHHPGTLISEHGSESKHYIRGISSISSVSLLQLKGSGLVGITGISSRLFGCLAKAGVSVILISQASSEHSICFAVAPEEAETAQKAVAGEFEYEIIQGRVDPVRIEPNHAIVAVVGGGMRHKTGITGRIFGAMGRNRINVAAIAQGSSELNVSFVVRREDVTDTLNVLHEAFFSPRPVTHVYLVGSGLIGKTLLQQLADNHERLLHEFDLEVRLCGVANSRKMIIDQEGIDPAGALEVLAASRTETDLTTFVSGMRRHTNSVLVDCTAGAAVPAFYPEALRWGISVVTPNKVGNTGSYRTWLDLQDLASQPRVNYFYEANVGAGLPIIKTVREMVQSGDKVTAIEAILSGTLSYLFNTFSGGMSFRDLLWEAKEKGFTEPDPRDDLSGTDVARKILMLARESGFRLEMDDIQVESLVPACCDDAESVDDFFEALAEADARFTNRFNEAEREGKALRYIAAFKDGKATVSLRAVGPDHPCHGVDGNDNIVSFTTQRYPERPLVVRGPGAGAEVTAAQVFSEIIEAARRARLSGVGMYGE
ncbi:MAG: bifunctional aspartate kinase/homoserine dehydrogenase I [Acidobacteriota bacterium]|nr:bifunctional aspartate kinase/homoserine dehydrogenase I [Acidobacteriota bacterium]